MSVVEQGVEIQCRYKNCQQKAVVSIVGSLSSVLTMTTKSWAFCKVHTSLAHITLKHCQVELDLTVSLLVEVEEVESGVSFPGDKLENERWA